MLNRFKSDNALQSENILYILFTFDVSKVDKSKFTNDEQTLNIYFILVTLEVLKYLSKLILVNFLKHLNNNDELTGALTSPIPPI